MRIKFYTYLIAPILLIICLFILSNYLFLFPTVKRNIVNEKKIMAKELTNIALNYIENYNRIEKDCLSIEEAQKQAIEQLRTLNYGHDNKSYFWVTDLTPTMIMHPYRQDLEGQNLSTFRDIKGTPLFNNAVDIATQSGEGFLEYYWQWQDDSTKQLPKISYIKLFKEWNWIVGTGVYTNDIEEELNIIRKSELNSTVFITIIMIILLIMITVFGIKTEKHRIKSQERLIRSEEKFRSLFQNSNDIIIISSLEGVILDINQKTLKTYGLKYEEVVGKTTFQMMPEKYHNTIAERIRFADNHDLSPIELELKPNENLSILVEVKSSLFTYGDKNVVLSTMRDITDRKIAEEKLRTINKNLELSEAKFKQLANLSFEGIAIHENGFVIELNLAFTHMFGYTKDDLLNKYGPAIIFDNKSQQTIATNLKKEISEPYELVGIKKDGSRFPVEVTGRIFHTNENGQSLRVSSFRDISDRKMQEKQLLNAIIVGEEKERTRIAKELHDGLGPYLSTMKFYFQWLAESDDDNKKKIIIEKGNQSIKEAITILREVSNNLNPHILTNYGLMDAINVFIEKFKENELLKITFLPLKDKTIPHQIEVTLYRIVIELLNNTFKHAKANAINITFTLCHTNRLEMEYSDNGIGFDLNKLKENNKGIGLLNIENRINSFDGELNIKTKLNEGFKAIITLKI